jgi:hypothetical protein
MRLFITIMGLAVGTALCGVALGGSSSAVVRAQTPSQAGPVEVAQQAIDAMNRGDVGSLLALYADDGTIEGFPDCATPCVGTQAIEQEFNAIVGVHVHVTVLDMQVSGNSVTSRFEATSDVLRQLQIDRVLGTFSVQVRGDKIASSSFVLDPNDPQTARILAMYAQQYPTNQPTPSAQLLPGSGSAAPSGLAFGWTAVAAVVGAFGVLALGSGLGMAALSRRRGEG